MNDLNRSRVGLVLLLLAAASPVATPASADGSMTDAERSYLLSELETSKAAMLKSIAGLSAAQWTFKPAPDVWSVQECAEHIILAEDLIFSEAQKTLKTPVAPRLPSANAEGDRKLVALVEDRSSKAKAPAAIVPQGKYATPSLAAQAFERRRDKTIAYVKTTQDALRAHTGDSPAGPIADVYQFLLELSAHSARHTAQIREVEAQTEFPKAP